MDEIARYNKERWEELARRGVEFSRPFLDLDTESARHLVDPHGILGDVEGRDVLCLASGGGQQSAAFAILGAAVTVFDISETQLTRDREAAHHFGLPVVTVQGDMRDLSAFANDSFDVVWHAFSISFVPDARPVLSEVSRVLRASGRYRIEFPNPFVVGLDEQDWNGQGYPLRRPYIDGAQYWDRDPMWDIHTEDGETERVLGPREFRHNLGTLVNALVELRFVILGLWEELGDPGAEPGTWDHFKAVAPPWLTIWAAYLSHRWGDVFP